MSVQVDEPQLFVSMSNESIDEPSTNCDEQQDSANDEQKCSAPASPDGGNVNGFDLDHKNMQRFSFGLNRNPLLNSSLPIFQALQNGQLNLNFTQLLGLASGLGAASPGNDDYDEENTNNGEPEDLTVVFRKENSAKSEDQSESGGNGGPGWSYEEQFKQLYELSDDLKRKEWLDDWLNFMHRIGKPVTRIPIMAKQVLDLYELYRLVVQHGGLVEIINKKLWREITKGLNLPSSITSAAFTLRTQYQKYLYDYECEKEKLSNPADLQQAIDGNRREAPSRRTGPPTFPLPFQLPHSASSLLNKQLNGLAMRGDLLDEENSLGLQGNLFASAYGADQMAILEAHQRHLRAAEQVARHNLSIGGSLGNGLNINGNGGHTRSGRESTSSNDSDIPVKRIKYENSSSEYRTNGGSGTTQSIKISSKTSESGATNSMKVSMEFNGITYQGVLFAAVPDENSKSSIDTDNP